MAQSPPQMNITPPNLSSNGVKALLIVILIVITLFNSISQIDAEEVGVVLQFGRYDREIQPGLNIVVPFVETVEKVPVLRQLKQEFGFRTVQSGVRSQFRSTGTDVREESLMLTGDLNAAQVEWIVQYSIEDARNYLFKVKNVENTFRYINEAVLREVVGDRSINEVITTGKEEIESLAKQLIQDLCRQYETGIKIEQLILQDVNPPDPVKSAFNAVNEAEQEKSKLIDQARSEYNKVIPKARGEAKRLIEEAKGYYKERINNAEGDASRFTALFNEYRKAKEVTRQRIYLETMEEVLTKVGKKLITDEKASGVLPLFNFSDTKKGGN